MTAEAIDLRSQYDKDRQLLRTCESYTYAQLLEIAARRSGLSPLALGRDYMRLARLGHGIEMSDYVGHQLWDAGLHGEGGAERYLGSSAHWPIVNRVNDPGWRHAAEDKLAMRAMFASAGLPQPDTVAMVDASARRQPGITKVETPEDLRDVVRAFPDGALFVKPVGGMVGLGAMVIERSDDRALTCSGTEPMTYAEFLGDQARERSYLIQKRLSNHPDLAPYLTGIATIRFPNFVDGAEIHTPHVAMKVTTGGNVTCAYWRPGNLAAEIDLETGRIVRLAKKTGPISESIPDHPETPGLMGLRIPFWDEVKALNEAAARLYAPIAYSSTDIAVTPEGPVVVELNYGGSFDILQNATGRGLLTDRLRDWLRGRGANIGAAPKGMARVLPFGRGGAGAVRI